MKTQRGGNREGFGIPGDYICGIVLGVCQERQAQGCEGERKRTGKDTRKENKMRKKERKVGSREEGKRGKERHDGTIEKIEKGRGDEEKDREETGNNKEKVWIKEGMEIGIRRGGGGGGGKQRQWMEENVKEQSCI